MSEESENDSDVATSTCSISLESDQDELPSNIPTDLVDEDNQFIYDDDSSSLICIGSAFDDIPASIIQQYALKTKVNYGSNNEDNTTSSFIHLGS